MTSISEVGQIVIGRGVFRKCRIMIRPTSLTRTLSTIVALASMGSFPAMLPQAHAGEETEKPHVQLGPWAGDLEVGPRMNAVGRHLKGSRFVGQDLEGAAFDGCDLDGVEFRGCDLSNASFKGAHMTGLLLEGCRIEGANFEDAIINGADLGRSRLSEKQLRSTHSYKTKDLHACTIYCFSVNKLDPPPSYDFRGASFFEAVLVGDFTRCDFTNASIKRARITRTITSAQLASTIEFKRRRLLGARLSGKSIEGKVDFSGMELVEATLYGPFIDANFDGATIVRSSLTWIDKRHLLNTKSYRDGDLSGITFTDMKLWGVDFSGVNLTNASFWGFCDFTGAIFEDAVITNVYFEGYNTGLTPDQIKSTWNYKHNRMEGIDLPKEVAAALKSERK